MICQSCKAREASVQFTEVVGEHKRSLWLCPDCSHTKGLYVSLEWAQGSPGRTASLRRCELCGSTLSAIRRSGRVGCANCYEEFAEFLEPLLQRVHGRIQHVQDGGAAAEQARLRVELEHAVQREDFELAARLRDRLCELRRPDDSGRP